MINELINIVSKTQDEFGTDYRDILLEEVGEEIDVAVQSLKTNYLTKRSYNKWKLPRAIKTADKAYERFKSKIGSETKEKAEPSEVDA